MASIHEDALGFRAHVGAAGPLQLRRAGTEGSEDDEKDAEEARAQTRQPRLLLTTESIHPTLASDAVLYSGADRVPASSPSTDSKTAR